MTLSTICSLLLATPFAASLLELTIALLPLITKVGLRIVAFRQGMITPAASLPMTITRRSRCTSTSPSRCKTMV